MRFLFCFLFSILSGCSESTQHKSIPYFKFPIDLSLGEQSNTYHVTIPETYIYAVGMKFYLYQDHSSDGRDMSEHERFSTLLGLGYATDNGIPAKYQITIKDTIHNSILSDSSITYPKSNASYGGRYTHLVTLTIPKGDYDITVKYLPYNPDLSKIYGEIFIGNPYNSK